MVILKRSIALLVILLLPINLLVDIPDINAAKVPLKDIARIQSKIKIPLLGYGLVVGLEGTGDSKGTIFTIQSLNNMMERMGITLPEDKVKVKNVAAVMVTSEVTPLEQVGGRIDVTVSSLGDASSLEGGMLLLTPLSAPTGEVIAWAQGPVSTGGFNAQGGGGDQVSNNYTLVGRVPSGGLIERRYPIPIDQNVIRVQLEMPDYTTADRLSKVVRDSVEGCRVEASSEKVVNIYPDDDSLSSGEMIALISRIENLEVETSTPARIVVNEKTGTIVAGANVSVDAIALAHGNLTVEIKSQPVISQPTPFSKGETVNTGDSEVSVSEEIARMVYLEESTRISDLARALNAIGATPRDIISILQALKKAGALHAELIII
ncbi:MAG: flagellar basal body P-ring protein FlgI [candidate division Zixibacteria bacterium]|nr:flagellar basal body P-ring protein FlgI [candidate division Zixibacteria bacterium]